MSTGCQLSLIVFIYVPQTVAFACRSPNVKDFLFMMCLLSGLPGNGNTDEGGRAKDKEIETVITGSKYSGGIGTIVAPPGYPNGHYTPDATSFIFILENVATEGSVQLIIEEFNIHNLSWITIRNSKYGGYIGRVIGRYDVHTPPPHVISTPTCCMRVEFQTGCCSEGDARFPGFKATYRFVLNRGRGRRVSCEGEKVYNQLCNGECILGIYDCPCPQYGQFKCSNGMCLTPEKVCNGKDDCGDKSDEKLCSYIRGRPEYDGMGSMYGFSVVISTVMSIVGTAFVLVFAIRCVENYRSRKWKKILKAEKRNARGPVSYAQMWPRPETGVLPSPSLARVFPVTPTSKARTSLAVLSVGRTPLVTVKPLPVQPTVHDAISGGEDAYDSDSSHCESGFHGDDDEACMTTSSETDIGRNKRATKDDLGEEEMGSHQEQDSCDEEKGCSFGLRLKRITEEPRHRGRNKAKNSTGLPDAEVPLVTIAAKSSVQDDDDYSDNPWRERTSVAGET